MTDTPPEEVNPPAVEEETPEVAPDPTVTPTGDTSSDSEVTTDDEPDSVPTDSEVVNTVTPPANPDVTPGASELPTPTPIPEPTPPLIPTAGGFGDSREVAAAEAAGIANPTGTPLSAASAEILRELEKAAAGIESWASWIRVQISRLPNHS